MSNDAFDEPEPQPASPFGAWKPGMNLVVRFSDPLGEDGPNAEQQERFIASLKNAAIFAGLALRDWGPEQGMVAKFLMEEDPDGDNEQRLRDIEMAIAGIAESLEILSTNVLPARPASAIERVTRRVQERAS
jgi:hypothetical protein